MKISIGSKFIGDELPAFMIAEAGVNHNGSLDLALELVKKAHVAGADCIKFQTFNAERIVTSSSPKASYQLKVTDPKESQLQMLKKLELPESAYSSILSLCKELGITFLSTPYSREDIDFLDVLGVSAFKIASGQISEHPFLKYAASKKKPLIISTGMASLEEVASAIELIRNMNCPFVVLQCTTNYPSKAEETNLRVIPSLRTGFQCLVGFSDHTASNYSSFASIALGACVIEKHFTLDRAMPGPDHSSSLTPQEFTELVLGVRIIESSLGSPYKKPSATEREIKPGMRRSLVARHNIKRGAALTEDNITFKRPGTGLAPNSLYLIENKTANQDIPEDTLITMEMIDW